MARSTEKRAKDFDSRLLRHFWKIAGPYWFSEEKGTGRGLLAVLVLLLLGRTEFAVLLNEQSGELTSALAARDALRFWHAMRAFGWVLVAAVPVYAFYYYVRDRLGIAWRSWLTRHFLRDYFARRAFYELTSDRVIDNPDQRMAEDILSFTRRSLVFLLEIISALLQLLAFSGTLWAISHTLVWFLVVYAVLGSVVTFGVFGKPLIALNFQQLRREADFRFALIRVRENAESIAFYRGEAHESAQVTGRFSQLYDNYVRLLKRTLGLNLYQYAYGFVTLVLPSLIIAPRVLSGELEVGRVVQAAGAFAAMLAALTVFVDNFELLSGFAAGIERLRSFARALALPAGQYKAQHTIERELSTQLELVELTLLTPGRERTLIERVSLCVEPGQGLLIAGASGGGKSSLLRAIAGLWNSGTGRILRPDLAEMLFLPQRPYMVLGSLRDQLLYPSSQREVSDGELARVLALASLPDLIARSGGLDQELDFAKTLSIGEQQRLAIARVFLTRPRFVLLDEATSALDVDNELRLYRELRAMDATLVSVTHRPELLEFHDQVLELVGDTSGV